MVEKTTPKCPMCGSLELEMAKVVVANSHKISVRPWKKTGFFDPPYFPSSFICLNCGYVGLYLGEDDLNALKSALNQ